MKLAIGCVNYIFGEGIKKLLEDEKEFEIIGIFSEGKDFKEIKKIKPEIVLLDFNIYRDLPEDFATDTQLKLLLISDHTVYPVLDRRIGDLISKGVVGILAPAADSPLLKRAIRAVSSGELWLDRKTMSNMLSNENLTTKEKVKISEAEKEIISLICQGFRNKEIAQKLYITEQTVKSHCNRIYKKLGITDRLQLAVYVHKLRPGWFL